MQDKKRAHVKVQVSAPRTKVRLSFSREELRIALEACAAKSARLNESADFREMNGDRARADTLRGLASKYDKLRCRLNEAFEKN